MPIESANATPILTLREHATALEAAITLVLADPRPKPVHRLRTSTRRIEAQLAMLELLPDLPEHAKPARKVVKGLKKLRRAAGAVRDLDVEDDLLKSAARGAGSKAAPKARKRKGTDGAGISVEGKPGKGKDAAGDAGGDEAKALAKDAGALAKILAEERKEEADALVHLLHKQQAKVSLALEALLDALEPARELALPPARVVELAEQWYSDKVPAADLQGEEDPNRLHTVRKMAKLARYMAENAPTNGAAGGGPAARFESLQGSGGAWHDLLTLRKRARKHLRKHSPLTEHLERSCSRALESFRAELAGSA